MAKSRVAIVADSTATLPPELIEQHRIHIIPQILNWEGKTYRDGIDITPDQFYERLGNARELPTTSQPSAGEFFEFFSRLAEEAESILGIFISDELSGTLDSAYSAKELMADFPLEIVDSRSAAAGLGFIVLEAARAVDRGSDYLEAAQVARDLVPRVHIDLVVDTLEFLHRGGRIGGAQRLVGSVLSIKPVLQVLDGRIEALASVRTKQKAVRYMLDYAADKASGQGPVHLAVLHAAAPDGAKAIADEMASRLNPVELIMTELSPVIGAHVGPGTLGVIYYSDES